MKKKKKRIIVLLLIIEQLFAAVCFFEFLRNERFEIACNS